MTEKKKYEKIIDELEKKAKEEGKSVEELISIVSDDILEKRDKYKKFLYNKNRLLEEMISLRESKKINKGELAEKLGVSFDKINELENPFYTPLFLLSKYLHFFGKKFVIKDEIIPSVYDTEVTMDLAYKEIMTKNGWKINKEDFEKAVNREVFQEMMKDGKLIYDSIKLKEVAASNLVLNPDPMSAVGKLISVNTDDLTCKVLFKSTKLFMMYDNIIDIYKIKNDYVISFDYAGYFNGNNNMSNLRILDAFLINKKDSCY